MFSTSLYPIQSQRKAHLEFCRTQLTPSQVLDIQSCALYNVHTLLAQNEDLAELYRRQERLRSSNPIDDQLIQTFVVPWEFHSIYMGLLDHVHRESRLRLSIPSTSRIQPPLSHEKEPSSDDEGYESSGSLQNNNIRSQNKSDQESSQEFPTFSQQQTEFVHTELSPPPSNSSAMPEPIPMTQQVRTCGRENERMEFRFAMFNILAKKTRDNPCHHYTPFLQRNPPILFNTPRLRPWPDPEHETRSTGSYKTFQPSPLQCETEAEDILSANLSHKHTPSQAELESNNHQQSWSDFVNETLSPLRDTGYPPEPPPLTLYSSPPDRDSDSDSSSTSSRRKRVPLHQPRPIISAVYSKKRLLASPPSPRRARSITSPHGELKRKQSGDSKKKRSNSIKKAENRKSSLAAFENSDSGLVVVTGTALAAERACRKIDDERCTTGRRRSKVVPRGEEKDVNVNVNVNEKKKGVLKVMSKFFFRSL